MTHCPHCKKPVDDSECMPLPDMSGCPKIVPCAPKVQVLAWPVEEDDDDGGEPVKPVLEEA